MIQASVFSIVKKLFESLEFLIAKVRNLHVDLNIQVALLIGVKDRHTLLLNHLHEARLGDLI